MSVNSVGPALSGYVGYVDAAIRDPSAMRSHVSILRIEPAMYHGLKHFNI